MTTPRRDMPSTTISSGASRRTCLTSSVLEGFAGGLGLRLGLGYGWLKLRVGERVGLVGFGFGVGRLSLGLG